MNENTNQHEQTPNEEGGSRACRACSECEGYRHHWLADPRPVDAEFYDYPAEYACKHCDIRGTECQACMGEGCEKCDNEGVNPATHFVRKRNGKNEYLFACPCGAEGELAVPVRNQPPFACPEGCGRTYVQFMAGKKLPVLRCVVKPVSSLCYLVFFGIPTGFCV